MGWPSRYPEEFRREAVQMALAADTSWASVTRRLGVNETTLGNWVHAHLAEEARAADPLMVSQSEFEELQSWSPVMGEERSIGGCCRAERLVGVQGEARERTGDQTTRG